MGAAWLRTAVQVYISAIYMQIICLPCSNELMLVRIKSTTITFIHDRFLRSVSYWG